VLGSAVSITVVADRESDIYEQFARRPEGVHLLTRAAQDRCLAEVGRLFATIDAWPEQHRETIQLSELPGRLARTACLALRFGEVSLRRPATADKELAACVDLFVVDVAELDAPAGAEPVHWRLLTTHTVATFADACRITGFYRQRWTIEQVFRVMKTKGFDIEAVRVAENGPFENLTTATLIAAIQVLQMVRERDGAAGRPLQDALDPEDQPALEAICQSLEGKTEKQKNPHPKGSLAYASWECARLGGWTGYYGKPGPIVMMQGLQSLKAMLHGWRLR